MCTVMKSLKAPATGIAVLVVLIAGVACTPVPNGGNYFRVDVSRDVDIIFYERPTYQIAWFYKNGCNYDIQCIANYLRTHFSFSEWSRLAGFQDTDLFTADRLNELRDRLNWTLWTGDGTMSKPNATDCLVGTYGGWGNTSHWRTISAGDDRCLFGELMTLQ